MDSTVVLLLKSVVCRTTRKSRQSYGWGGGVGEVRLYFSPYTVKLAITETNFHIVRK